MSLGWRERKKLATRQAIKDTALNLALEFGVEVLTVEAITEAAGVAPRTFFNYFSCKEDVLVVDVAEAAAELHTLIVDRPAVEPPLRTLHAVIADSDVFGAVNVDRQRLLAQQQLVQDHPSLLSRQLAQYAAVERTFAQALAERLDVDPDQDLRPSLLAALAVSVLKVAMRRWTADGSQPLGELINSAFCLLEQGDAVESTAEPIT